MTQIAVSTEPTSRVERNLETLFAPRSIAVIGASRKENSVGRAITHNLIVGGYTGVVYPVNPKATNILGIRCVPRIQDLDEVADLAVIVVPAEVVEDAINECADHGTRHFLVISAGFKEVGSEGAKREDRLRSVARSRNLSILGPNCLGVINTARNVKMNASFARGMPEAGAIGLLSQSGALCTALLDYAKGRGIGFSRFVSFGNKVDIDETELLQSLADDPHTRVILMYIEDLSNGRAFLDAADEITHGANAKPVLAIKSGRTPEGAAAAASHTGSLAGSDEVYDAVMSQAGVLRIDTVKQLFDFARCLADPTMPRGRRTAIVTNAGGPGIMATDACVRHDLKLAQFRKYTYKSLKFQMPAAGSVKNPVDVLGDAKHDRYRAAFDAVCSDEGVDQMVVIVTPQTMTDVTEIAEVIRDCREFCNKPIVTCMMGLVDVSPGVELLKKSGIPAYIFPEDAVRSLAAKNRFAESSRMSTGEYQQFDVDRRGADELFTRELAEGRSQLVELRALEVLERYGFPVVPFRIATAADQAVAVAREIGFPVALKIAGPNILHKSDVGGVRLHLTDEESVRCAYDEMVRAVRGRLGPDEEVWGVLVQKMLSPGKEVILGMTRHERFGPLLMFGLGGIYTEALHDVAFRLSPIRNRMAAQMVRDIRSYRLLEGVRGEPPSDIEAIAECLMRLSQLVDDHPSIKELDINPLIVYPQKQGAIVADARIILGEI